jgi:hypothetical protein
MKPLKRMEFLKKNVIYIYLSGSKNLTKGPVKKLLSGGLRDCFHLSNKLMVLENTFSLGLNPTIPSSPTRYYLRMPFYSHRHPQKTTCSSTIINISSKH